MGITNTQTQTTAMQKQNCTSTPDSCYTIGNYQICTHEKKVKVYTMIGGVNWDGYTYKPLDHIDFENTEMYLIGNSVVFKEQTEGRDLKSGYFLYPKSFQLNDPQIPLVVFDNDSVFQINHLTLSPLISTRDKRYLGNYLFEDKDGKLYTLINYERTLSPELPCSLGIDKATLKHVCDDYFYDKNQIYHLSYYTVEESGKWVSYFGKVIGKNEGKGFCVGKNYCCINNRVYLRKKHEPLLLDLNASAVREYLVDNYYSTYLITDGKKMYIHSLHYQGTDFKEIKELSNLDLYPVIPNTAIWYYTPQNKIVYLHPDTKQASNLKSEFGLLMYSNIDNKAVIINREGNFKIYDGILLPDNERNTPKIFDHATDLERLKTLKSFMYYNFNPIFYNALLQAYKKHGINADLLARVGETIFYTDGTNLVWLNEAQHIDSSFGKDEAAQNGVLHLEHLFTNWICRIDAPDNLAIINDNMLTDGTTLYYIDKEARKRKLKAVSLSSLGLPVFFLEQGKSKMHHSQ